MMDTLDRLMAHYGGRSKAIVWEHNIPRRYDAFLFVEQSRAVDPLHMPAQVAGEPGETYPTGV